MPLKCLVVTDDQIVLAWDVLTPLEQGIVSAHRREGKPFRVIAQESGRAVSTVTTHWYRACRKISAA